MPHWGNQSGDSQKLVFSKNIYWGRDTQESSHSFRRSLRERQGQRRLPMSDRQPEEIRRARAISPPPSLCETWGCRVTYIAQPELLTALVALTDLAGLIRGTNSIWFVDTWQLMALARGSSGCHSLDQMAKLAWKWTWLQWIWHTACDVKAGHGLGCNPVRLNTIVEYSDEGNCDVDGEAFTGTTRYAGQDV